MFNVGNCWGLLFIPTIHPYYRRDDTCFVCDRIVGHQFNFSCGFIRSVRRCGSHLLLELPARPCCCTELVLLFF